jgi:hypothetical protein
LYGKVKKICIVVIFFYLNSNKKNYLCDISFLLGTSTEITARKNNKQDLGITKLNLRMKVCDDNASEDAGQNIHGRDAKNCGH